MSLSREPAGVQKNANAILMALACACAGSLYGWSALIPTVRGLYGASHAQTAFIFSVAIVSFTVSVLLAPRATRLWRDILTMRIALVLGGGSLVVAAFSPSLTIFTLAYGCVFGAVAGLIYISALDLAAQTKRSGLVVPLMVAAFGGGGAVFGAVASLLVGLGWGTGTLLPIAAILVLIAACLKKPSRTQPQIRKTVADKGQQMKARRFLAALWVVFALGSASGLMVIGLASQFVVDRSGMALLVGLAVAGVAIGNAFGRIGVGLVAGKSSARSLIVASQILAMTSLAGLLVHHGPQGAVFFLTVTAVGYGMLAAAVPNAIRERLGAEGFASGYGIVFSGWGVAGFVAPWLAGAIRDHTGSLDPALAGAMLASLIAVAIALVMARQDRSTSARYRL